VTTPDFEITACLRARKLMTHVPPDAQTEATGEDVTIVRRQRRRGLPAKTESGGRYSDIVVEKRLAGEKGGSGQMDAEAQPASERVVRK
jgi:hypothetical protein